MNETTQNKQKLIAICGPTASGKTALSVELALRIGGEIISCDSMMVYRGMDIGTAKTTVAEMRGVPHHMLSVTDPSQNYSAAEYRDSARLCIDEIAVRGNMPIMCGGTGLYLDAVTRRMSFANAQSDPELRAELEKELAERGAQALHDRLSAADPEAAARLHVNDTRRVIRALEIKLLADRGESQPVDTDENRELYDLKLFALNLDRAWLYERIDRRVDIMCANGLFDEVEGLLKQGLNADCTAMQAIGYKEAAQALRGELTQKQAIDLIKQRSRNYAKRQLSWLRRDTRTIWLDVYKTDDASSVCDRLIKYLDD